MGLKIATNLPAINAHRTLGNTDSAIQKNMERLSSGYRINRAKDDAAGLAQAQSLRSQNMSMGMASRNVTQANAMLQTAEGGADQIHNMLLRLKELATQAASQNSNSNLGEINNEATAIKNEIERIANSTKYLGEAMLTGYGSKSLQSGLGKYAVDNVYDFDVTGASQGTYVVTGTATAMTMWNASDSSLSQQVSVGSGSQTLNFSTFGVKFSTTSDFVAADNGVSAISALATANGFVVTGSDATFQIGQTNDANFQLNFSLDDLGYSSLGSDLSIKDISLASLTDAQSAMDAIDIAIDQVSNARGDIGALQNRLDYTYAALQTSIENVAGAESAIRDVDMAQEMVGFTKNQILMQAGTAMLAQANMAPQQVLQLLG